MMCWRSLKNYVLQNQKPQTHMTKCSNLIHSLTLKRAPRGSKINQWPCHYWTLWSGEHTLHPCSFQRWPLRTDHFLWTCLAQSCPATCHSYSHLCRREKRWKDRVNFGVLQQGFGVCQVSFTCVTSLVLTLTQCGIAILQMGILRHQSMNLPQVSQFRGINWASDPVSLAPKAMPLTTMLHAVYLPVIPTYPLQFLTSSCHNQGTNPGTLLIK